MTNITMKVKERRQERKEMEFGWLYNSRAAITPPFFTIAIFLWKAGRAGQDRFYAHWSEFQCGGKGQWVPGATAPNLQDYSLLSLRDQKNAVRQVEAKLSS